MNRQIAKGVVDLGQVLHQQIYIEEAMIVDTNKYKIKIPSPAKIDASQ